MKIIQGICAFQEAEFLSHALESLKGVVDKVVIVEGAIEGHWEPFYCSQDGTLEQIEAFKRLSNTEVIHIPPPSRPWKNHEEQKQAMWDHLDVGDWCLINDADELYDPKDIERLRELIVRFPEVGEFVPIFIHYVDSDLIRHPEDPCVNVVHQRFIRKLKGSHFSCHHPTLCDRNHVDTCLDKRYQNRRMLISDWFVHHYGLCRPLEYLFQKEAFYLRVLRDYKGTDVCDDYALEKQVLQKVEELREGRILKYTGKKFGYCAGHIKFPWKVVGDWRDAVAYRIRTLEDLKSVMSGRSCPRLLVDGEEVKSGMLRKCLDRARHLARKLY
jgi:hypothetical protein